MANVIVTIRFRQMDGTSNGTDSTNCGTLAPSETCQVHTGGFGNDFAMFCEVTYSAGRLSPHYS